MTERSHARRRLVSAGLGIFALLLAANLAKLLHFAWFSIHYRYDLDYGEGIVWQQMINIVAGHGYAPIGVFPAIVYHYPPVYHLTTAMLAGATGLDQLMAGRLVSLLGTLAAMILLGVLTASAIPRDEERAVRWAAGAIAGLLLASAPEIVTWSSVMRVDMLACAFGFGGLLLAVHAVRHPWAAWAGAVAFVLAIYTKQTSIAAPAAAFAGLWLARPRSAWLLLALCLAFGLAALAYLEISTQGGFLHHIVVYNINRLDPGRALPLIRGFAKEIILIAISGFGVAAAWRRLGPQFPRGFRDRFSADPSLMACAMLLVFLALKVTMLPMVLKSGAASNYLIEWICALAIFTGLGVVPALRFAFGHRAQASPLLLALAAAGLPLTVVRTPDRTPDAMELKLQTAQMAGIVALIRASPKPVIGDDMVLIIRAGRAVLWEPAIAAELAHGGRYDQPALVRMIRRGDFGFVFTHGTRGSEPFDERYNPPVADAIDAAYPRLRQFSNRVLHLPMQQPNIGNARPDR